MKMRQSLAQFEAAFREEAAESVDRRERLRRQAVNRSRARRFERVEKAGTMRFVGLCLVILATTMDARYPIADPIVSRIQTTSVHPEITSGAVLPGCRTERGAADSP